MPLYNPERVEYTYIHGHIQVVLDGGTSLPAYWAHPDVGGKFPGVALLHDWWGVTDLVRWMAHQFAQSGYYVIVPDLFNGQVATTPQHAMQLVEILGDNAYPRIDAALSVLETHHRCNHDVAAVGIGMGGSLAYEASILRDDLEAAVAYYGFPGKYFGRFPQAKAPILAFYGSAEPYITPATVRRLKRELAQGKLQDKNQVMVIDGAGHEFFMDNRGSEEREHGRIAWETTMTFLDSHLKRPTQPPQQAKAY